MKTYHLEAGELRVAKGPVFLTTTVGSCIAFCLWDNALKQGGMVHYALPTKVNLEDHSKPLYYFGDKAIISIFRELKKSGSNPKNLVVKIVGGAKVVPSIKNRIDIKNINIARSLCNKFSIPIAAEAIGGNCGYVVKFDMLTGKILVKKSEESSNSLNNIGLVKKSAFTSPAKADSLKNVASLTMAKNEIIKKELEINRKLKILIVDDSTVIQKLLIHIITQHENLEVIAVANCANDAEEKLKTCVPDAITLDINMPGMTGLEYLKQKLCHRQIPVIVISGAGKEEGELALQTLENGAFDFMEKPSGDLEQFGKDLGARIFASVKHRNQSKSPVTIENCQLVPQENLIYNKVVLLGSSTGGTIALSKILTAMPDSIPPILVVQHIPPGFSKRFAESLNAKVKFQVREAVHGDSVEDNTVYISPGDRHMKLRNTNGKKYVNLVNDPPFNQHKPAVDILFESGVKEYGKEAIGVLLTGMGKDGASGLLKLKESGAFTIAQDEESSVVWGMPKAAIDLGAACKIVSLKKMATQIITSCQDQAKKTKAS